MAVQALQGAGLDPAYVVGGELRSTRATPAGGRASGSWSRPTSQTGRCSSSSPRSPCSPTPSSTTTPPTRSRLDLEQTFAEFMARAGERAVVWDRPELRALCPGGGVPYDAPGVQLDPEGSRFDWQRHRGAALGPGRPQRRQRRRRAHRLRVGRGRPGGRRRGSGRLPRRPAPDGARRGDARPAPQVYDDYAHHPTEVAAAIAAARTLGARRLVAVFQPHLYSRTRALARAFGVALAAADAIVVLGIYPARERAEDFPGVSGRLVAAQAADAAGGRSVAWMPGFDEARAYLRRATALGRPVPDDGRGQHRRSRSLARRLRRRSSLARCAAASRRASSATIRCRV